MCICGAEAHANVNSHYGWCSFPYRSRAAILPMPDKCGFALFAPRANTAGPIRAEQVRDITNGHLNYGFLAQLMQCLIHARREALDNV